MENMDESLRFFKSCEAKLDRIIQEIETLRNDMTEKYKKLHFQFKILVVTLGACISITVHQIVYTVLRLQ